MDHLERGVAEIKVENDGADKCCDGCVQRLGDIAQRDDAVPSGPNSHSSSSVLPRAGYCGPWTVGDDGSFVLGSDWQKSQDGGMEYRMWFQMRYTGSRSHSAQPATSTSMRSSSPGTLSKSSMDHHLIAGAWLSSLPYVDGVGQSIIRPASRRAIRASTDQNQTLRELMGDGPFPSFYPTEITDI